MTAQEAQITYGSFCLFAPVLISQANFPSKNKATVLLCFDIFCYSYNLLAFYYTLLHRARCCPSYWPIAVEPGGTRPSYPSCQMCILRRFSAYSVFKEWLYHPFSSNLYVP